MNAYREAEFKRVAAQLGKRHVSRGTSGYWQPEVVVNQRQVHFIVMQANHGGPLSSAGRFLSKCLDRGIITADHKLGVLRPPTARMREPGEDEPESSHDRMESEKENAATVADRVPGRAAPQQPQAAAQAEAHARDVVPPEAAVVAELSPLVPVNEELTETPHEALPRGRGEAQRREAGITARNSRQAPQFDFEPF